ncbi:bis(5'-nucleosyl)-tetraphosphatase (symmetrical) YqeK [uncultured Parolsenella sp.]|uniref:bis(5'-nucleosyl)-tetraphosphatase (symmetrical) YqeK n=1 Tax=uncultured Parolsenella sp. TaxID=2083008 RepID=UPI0025E75D1C|nr:bis(5'-nucleosyl)-tetraphosphatase (symmetrical) YqeK [uncultured Parolsenella sp.]
MSKKDDCGLWKSLDVSWLPNKLPTYSDAESTAIDRYETALAKQLEKKPKRFSHSLSVGLVAERLALAYGICPYPARVAGILHDWSKGLPNDELLGRASALGIDLGVDYSLVEPVLHGMVAARELPGVFPELTNEVLQAIERHTLGDSHMSPLDMVIFVADGIEPFRKNVPAIVSQRNHAGSISLPDLFWESFADGVSYVIDTRRYLYPGTLNIYNDLVLSRAAN